jgi:hypothetical protein
MAPVCVLATNTFANHAQINRRSDGKHLACNVSQALSFRVACATAKPLVLQKLDFGELAYRVPYGSFIGCDAFSIQLRKNFSKIRSA